ncbi:hypothetical protein JKY72_03160 [Candidatus Gracilibacteria bacterium]|nr:hypothetical protein [Candidatus Gracilibacteria bacterium]
MGALNGRIKVECPRCGKYDASDMFLNFELAAEYRSKRHILSAILRERSEKGLDVFIVNRQQTADATPNFFTLEDLLSKTDIPVSPEEKALKLLQHMRKATGDEFGKRFSYNNANHYPLAYARSEKEFGRLITLLAKLGYIEELEAGWNSSLTVEGWKKTDEIKKQNPDSNQGFVAMWFSGYKTEVDHPKHETITKADRDTCYQAISSAFKETPFKPLRIDNKEHNNKICDEIILGINQSKFLIADVTGNRGGVYFEAGFAKSLGMEVIWLCKKGFAKDDMHFDTNHYNHIVYDDYEELTKRLSMRILATVT